MGRTVQHRGAQSRVHRYLLEHANQDVHRDTIAKELGLPDQTVSNSIFGLKNKPGSGITQTAQNVYRYSPGAASDSEAGKGNHVYEQRGIASNGDHIIEDESGTLYRAVPL